MASTIPARVLFVIPLLYLLYPCAASSPSRTTAAEAYAADCQARLQPIDDERPEGVAGRLRTAYCHLKAGRFEEAQQILATLGDEASLVSEYVSYYQGVAAMRRGRWNEAARHFYATVLAEPARALRDEALLGLGRAYHESGYFKGAVTTYKKLYLVAGSDEMKATALAGAADALSALGDHAGAAQEYKRLWIEHPDTEAASRALAKAIHESELAGVPLRVSKAERRALGDRLFRLGRWAEALEQYERAEPTDGVLINMAIARYRTGDIDEGLRLLRKVRSARSLWWQATLHIRSGDTEKALRTLVSIARLYPSSPLAPEGLYRAARLRQMEEQWDKALKLYRKLIASFPRHRRAKDAQWETAWISYRRGRYREAARGFARLGDSRGEYWRARALEKMGSNDEARRAYSRLASSRPGDYYAFLARQRIGAPTPPGWTAPEAGAAGATADPDPAYESDIWIRKAKTLVAARMYADALGALEMVDTSKLDERSIRRLGRLFEMAQAPYKTIKLASLLDGPARLALAYPRGMREWVARYAAAYGVDEDEIFSIIREESHFNPRAVSRSGAVGLMQIMPQTALMVARLEGLNDFSLKQLYSPPTNLLIGTAYFKRLVERFDGRTVYAIAGYNGGPHNVERWLAEFGHLEADEFVEEIPYRETRNYVKKVLGSYGVYTALHASEVSRN